MHFILGGRGQGKLKYAEKIVKENSIKADMSNCEFDDIFNADIVYNLHDGIRKLLADGIDPKEKFSSSLDRLSKKVLIGNEIGSGIVPAEAFERNWRDETGRVYVLLSAYAERVDRVWAGCIQKLKG